MTYMLRSESDVPPQKVEAMLKRIALHVSLLGSQRIQRRHSLLTTYLLCVNGRTDYKLPSPLSRSSKTPKEAPHHTQPYLSSPANHRTG